MTASTRPLPRTFWVLWTGTLVNRLGSFVLPFLAFYLTQERGFSATFAGLVVSLYGAGGLIAGLVGGILADRVGRRFTMLLSLFGTAPVMVAIALVTQPIAIAAATFLLGCVSELYRPAVQAVIADLLPEEDRLRGYALLHWAVNIGFSLSPLIGGLVARESYLWLFVGDALTTGLFGLVVLTQVKETRPTAPAGARSALPGGVLGDRTFMFMATMSFLLATVFMQCFSALPIDMGQEGFSPREYGFVLALNGILIVILQPLAPRLVGRFHPAHAMALAALLTGAGFGMFALAHAGWAFAAAVAVWTLGEIISAPVGSAMVARMAPPDRRGQYQGAYAMSWGLGNLVAPAAGAAVLDSAGRGTLWTGCLVVGLLSAAGFLRLRKRLPDTAPAR